MRIFCLSIAFAVLSVLRTPAIGQVTPETHIIAFDVSTFPEDPSFNYDMCFAIGAELGMGSIGLFQNWTALEVAPETYDFAVLDIANLYYSATNMPLDLTLAPIHTNNLEVPADLVGLAFDDPLMVQRFTRLLDSVHVHLPDVSLASLVIGSEHDALFGSDAAQWAAYTAFYASVSDHARSLWPGLVVASELTFSGIVAQNSFAQSLNAYSDCIGVSYYPLNADFTVKPTSTVPTDFETLVALYPDKPIYFYQYGYPSSAVCNSSEALQAEFIDQTFITWDAYSEHVYMIDFTWLHDLDTDAMNFFGEYYGLTDGAFLEFLRSLGFREWEGMGSDKPALHALRCQAQQRNFNALGLDCTVSVDESDAEEKPTLKVYPNPASHSVTVALPDGLSKAEFSVFASDGRAIGFPVQQMSASITLDISRFANGMYSFVALTEGQVWRTSFAVYH